MPNTDLRVPSRSLDTTSGSRPMRIKGVSLHGTYATARSIASFFGLFGWILVVVSAIAGFGGLNLGAPFNILVVVIAVGVAALGLLLVAAQQMLRAGVDSADYARQALILQVALAEGRTEIDVQRLST